MNSRRGVGLIEVLVAIAILATILVFIVPSFTFYLQVNTQSEIRTQAVTLAQEALEQLRLFDPRLLPTSGEYPISADYTNSSSTPQTCPDSSNGNTSNGTTNPCEVERHGRKYEVKVAFCPENTSYCNDNQRHVRVEVKYRGDTVYEVETVFTKLR